MRGRQFSVAASDEGGFYVIVGETVSVYEAYEDALVDIQPTLADDTDAFLAEVLITPGGADEVSVTLEQVAWQTIIRDLSSSSEESAVQSDQTASGVDG